MSHLLDAIDYWDRPGVLLDVLARGGDQDRLAQAFLEELDELEKLTMPALMEREAAERGDPKLVGVVDEFLGRVESKKTNVP